MTYEHTRGPWETSPATDNTIAVVTRTHETPLAANIRAIGRSVDEAEANASLIAASPDLLDVVKRYLNYHDGVARCDSAEEVQECSCAVCATARPLVARVEGRS